MSGHGWVTPNADGTRARCGGPGMCKECALEYAQKHLRTPARLGVAARLLRECIEEDFAISIEDGDWVLIVQKVTKADDEIRSRRTS